MAASAGTRIQNKPAAAGVSIPPAILIVWAAGEFGLVVPPEVSAAFVGWLASLAYWIAPAKEPAG